MKGDENTGVLTATEGKSGETGRNEKIKGERFKGQPPQDSTSEAASSPTDQKKRRKHHRQFIPSVNVNALKELEGITTSSFIELVRAVILIDGKPYSDKSAPLSKNRKSTFKRLIEHYAVLERAGERQYYIKIVYSDKQIEELREAKVNAIKDNAK